MSEESGRWTNDAEGSSNASELYDAVVTTVAVMIRRASDAGHAARHVVSSLAWSDDDVWVNLREAIRESREVRRRKARRNA